MRTCYVVLSHVDTAHVLALVRRIKQLSPGCDVLVRHDQRGEALSSGDVAAAGGVLLDSGIEVGWGRWSLVAAILEAFRNAAERFDPDLTVLVSGQDWPARRLDVWERESAQYDAVLRARPVQPGQSILRDAERTLADRYDYSWRPLPRFWARWPRSVRRIGAALWYKTFERVRVPLLVNRLPRENGWMIGLRTWALRGIKPVFKGEQWCAVSRVGFARLQRFEQDRPTQFAAFHRMLIPDESYIQSVLLGDPEMRVLNASVSWHEFPADSPNHPRPVAEEDLEAVRRSGAPFARKIGSRDAAVRDRLTALVDAAETTKARTDR